MISLKLIVEDEDIMEKINQNLSPQIRVWGIKRTNQSFSAYQLCDSRIYEYLIPTYSFLPPHPSSFLGQRILQYANEAGDFDKFCERQVEVSTFWENVEEEYIKPLLNAYDSETRDSLERALYDPEKPPKVQNEAGEERELVPPNDEEGDEPIVANDAPLAAADSSDNVSQEVAGEQGKRETQELSLVAKGIKELRQAYLTAKRAYRISPERLQRVHDAFEPYRGTHSFHNYTVDKSHTDPSAKRVIRSFTVNPHPIMIGGSEWLSLKVHGQSFMMHQIRKMVGMVALVIRSGCEPHRIVESYGKAKISIPKAPGLGLLLERPVFDSYNKRAVADFGWQALDFDQYQKEIEEFKQREIYERIYREEANDNVFSNFFNHIDGFQESTFLFLTSKGIDAVSEGTQEGVEKDSAVLETVDSEAEEQADGQGAEG